MGQLKPLLITGGGIDCMGKGGRRLLPHLSHPNVGSKSGIRCSVHADCCTDTGLSAAFADPSPYMIPPAALGLGRDTWYFLRAASFLLLAVGTRHRHKPCDIHQEHTTVCDRQGSLWRFSRSGALS